VRSVRLYRDASHATHAPSRSSHAWRRRDDASFPVGAGGVTGRLLTAREVADRLGVTAETVLRWTRRGELPAFKLPGGAIRFREAELDEWLERHATAGDGSEEVSPTPNATRQVGVSSLSSPIPLRTEEDT
jgi:excisionase family DNA binding protein